VLQARLDALPADELVALQEASIVGPVFWDSALATIDAIAPARLPALAARQLVVARGGSAFAQAAELAFHHQLLHDVTYHTVLGPARREGHARVARWLADRVADRAGEFLGITAEHFERAGDSAQALEYYDRARRDAEQRYAHDAALAYAERALRQPALTAPIWRYQLHSSCQRTLDAMGRTADAQAALAAMTALAESQNSDAMRADLFSAEMLRADREGRAADAERLAHQTAAMAQTVDAPAAGALSHGELAWLALMRNDHATAEQHLEQGMVYARLAAQRPWREGGYAYYESQLRAITIESLLMRERYFDAARAVHEALAVLPARLQRDRVNLLLRLARSAAGCGELAAAIDAATRSLTCVACSATGLRSGNTPSGPKPSRAPASTPRASRSRTANAPTPRTLAATSRRRASCGPNRRVW
jgi:predicted ATPase